MSKEKESSATAVAEAPVRSVSPKTVVLNRYKVQTIVNHGHDPAAIEVDAIDEQDAWRKFCAAKGQHETFSDMKIEKIG